MSVLESQKMDMAPAAHKQIYGNSGGFQDLRNQARDDQKSALRPVAEQFESMFLSQILKQSREVSFDDKFMDGENADFYKDWYDQQLAQDLGSKGSLGLADKIVEELSPKLQALSPEALAEHKASKQAYINEQTQSTVNLNTKTGQSPQTTQEQLDQRALLP